MIQKWYNEYKVPDHLEALEDDDWEMLAVYENAMKNVVQLANVLEGELYPTTSSVIPFLDTIYDALKTQEKMLHRMEKDQECVYVGKLLKNLKSPKSLGEDGYKDKAPFNTLTLLDPHYMSIYFDHKGEQVEKALDTIADDVVLDGVEVGVSQNEDDQQPAAATDPTNVACQQVPVPSQNDRFGIRRAKLLAAWQAEVLYCIVL